MCAFLVSWFLTFFLYTTYTCPPNLVLLFMVMIYEPQPIPGPCSIFTRSLIESSHKLNTPHSGRIHHLITFFGTLAQSLSSYLQEGKFSIWVLPRQSRSLTEFSHKEASCACDDNKCWLEQTGYFYVLDFSFLWVTLLYSFWLISRNTWFWDFLRLLQTFWHWWTS
jgi:hypothetical protein